MTHWWTEPQRIVQTNLRLIDAELEPDALADDLVEFGATAMLFNVGGIFAWYPSELPLQAKNPFLNRDILAQMITAAHQRGIKVIGRYDLSKGTTLAYEAHPDWFCHDKDGQPFEYHGTYQACVNGGWYQHQAVAMLEESLGRYAIDGMFFNMFGYLKTDYSYKQYGICHCAACKEGFRAFANADLPDTLCTSNPVYRQYLSFQDATSKSLSAKILEKVKSVRPDVGVANIGERPDFFRGEVNRRLDRVVEWPFFSGEQARLFRSIGGDTIRHSSALTHFVDFPWRYSAESAAAQQLRMAQQLANGADPHYYFMGTPSQPDTKPLAAMREMFAYKKRFDKEYRDLASDARIAIYHSAKSARYHPDASYRPQEAFRGAYRALIESGVPFDVISDRRGEDERFAADHAEYDTVMLPGVSCLSDAEARNLDAFASAGGTLVAMGPVGRFDEKGNERAALALGSLPVESVRQYRESTRGGYMVGRNGEYGELGTDRALMDGGYVEVVPSPGAETEFELLLPQRFGPPELCFPERELASALAGVISGRHGSGRAIFVPWQPDILYHQHCLTEHRALIAGLARRHTRKPTVSVEGASRIEMTVQRQSGTGALMVHLVNYSGQAENAYNEPITVHGLKLRIAETEFARGRALWSGVDLDIVPGEGELVVEVPPLSGFEAIYLER